MELAPGRHDRSAGCVANPRKGSHRTRTKLYENTSLLITTNLAFADWPQVFGDAKMTIAMLDRLTHHCVIVETGNTSWRFKNRTRADLRNAHRRQTATFANARRHGSNFGRATPALRRAQGGAFSS